jgi:hypothetical protein
LREGKEKGRKGKGKRKDESEEEKREEGWRMGNGKQETGKEK